MTDLDEEVAWLECISKEGQNKKSTIGQLKGKTGQITYPLKLNKISKNLYRRSTPNTQFDVWLYFAHDSGVPYKVQVIRSFCSANITLCSFYNALTHSLDMLALLSYIFIVIKTLRVQQSPLFDWWQKLSSKKYIIQIGKFYFVSNLFLHFKPLTLPICFNSLFNKYITKYVKAWNLMSSTFLHNLLCILSFPIFLLPIKNL